MSSNDFTDRESQLMALAWRCFEDQPKVNYQKLADLAGMTNPVSASNAWAKIKKKLAAQAGDIAADGSCSSSTPKLIKKRNAKKAADADADDGGEEDEAVKPAKKKRGPKKPAQQEKSASPPLGEEELEAVKDEEDDFV